MTDDLIFKKFDRTDLSKQRMLFEECFPETKNTEVLSSRHYDWKFNQFPKDTKSFEYVCYLGNDLIGYYAAIPYSYKVFDQVAHVGMVCDVMTGIAARGKGIFTKLGNFATHDLKKSGITFTTGYPIRKEVIPGHLKVGWEIVFKLPMYIKFLKFDKFFATRGLAFLAPLFNSIFYALSFCEALFLSKEPLKFQIASIEEFTTSSNFSVFIETWMSETKIALNKDKDFLRWRFGAPGSQYKVVTMQLEDKLIGVGIVRSVIQEQVPTLAILDFMVLAKYSSYSTNLSFEIKRYAIECKDEFIISMMNPTLYKKYRFLKSLFIRSPFVFKLILKRLNLNFAKDKLYQESNWHLMWIDSDDL